MRICVDARCLMEGRRTGVEEYTLNLLVNLFEIDKENEYVLFLNSWKKPKNNLESFKKYKNVRIERFRFPNKLLNLSFWYLNWPKIDKLVLGADVVFLPNLIFGAVSKKTKLAITVHDLSFERHSEYFSLKRKLWHIFINPKSICQKADKIIAVSESTKKDIISRYKIKPEKIVRIYNAVSKNFRVINRNDEKLIKAKEKYKLPFKFVLYLGTIEPRKNIAGIIRAFNLLQKKARISGDENILKYHLVIAGERGWMKEKILEELEKSPFKNKIIMANFIEDEDKVFVYNLSSLFVYPSFFEGFGFPPLEAMRSGIPTIVSNRSSLPEVVGDAGILIDPDKPEEIYRAINEILTNNSMKENLIQKGLGRSEMFDWKNTAQEVLNMFGKMV